MSVYDLSVEKLFTLAEIAQAELNFDWSALHMTPEQRKCYIHAAIEIGAREAARYPAQNVNALAMQLGVSVQDGRNSPATGVYAEYDAQTHRITVYEAGVRSVALRVHTRVKTAPKYNLLTDTTKEALLQTARELLIAHELFHHLEATCLGPIHRTLPPVYVPVLGNFWKMKRYVKRTREIAAHSFAHHLLGMTERFPIENI